MTITRTSCLFCQPSAAPRPSPRSPLSRPRSKPRWDVWISTMTFWTVIPVDTAQALDAASFAGPLSTALRPVLFLGQSLMLLRIVLSWFPEVKETEVPWLFAYLPTEPILKATRKVVPPAFGVDISPVVWLALFSLVGEILIGPQGILNLIQRSASLS